MFDTPNHTVIMNVWRRLGSKVANNPYHRPGQSTKFNEEKIVVTASYGGEVLL